MTALQLLFLFHHLAQTDNDKAARRWSSSFDNPGCQAASPATSARGRRQVEHFFYGKVREVTFRSVRIIIYFSGTDEVS